MDTIDEGGLALEGNRWGNVSSSRLGDTLSYGAISQEHELLDQLMGGLTLLDLDGNRLTSLVEFEANFGAIKGNTPPLEAPSTELLSQSMQAKYSLCVVAVAGIDDLLSLFVGEASLTADHRSGDTSRAKIRYFVQLEYTAVGVLIFIGAERTEEVAQSLR